jgi:hypothetical protein
MSEIVATKDSRKYKTLVTDLGNEKIAAAALNGEKVSVVAAGVGDGDGAYYLPTSDQTALKREVWRGDIANKEINALSKNMIDIKIVLDGSVGGFTVREIGLFDEDGDMIAVCNVPDTEKVVIADGIAATLTLIMHVAFVNVDAVEFNVDPNMDTASVETARITVKREDWETAEDESGYAYQADAAVSEATSLKIPIVTLDTDSLSAASASEVSTTAETISGAVRLRAKSVPSTDLTGTVTLIGQGGSSSGGGSGGGGTTEIGDGLTYTADGKVAVKTGDGLTIDEDGAVAVDGSTMTDETKTTLVDALTGSEEAKAALVDALTGTEESKTTLVDALTVPEEDARAMIDELYD